MKFPCRGEWRTFKKMEGEPWKDYLCKLRDTFNFRKEGAFSEVSLAGTAQSSASLSVEASQPHVPKGLRSGLANPPAKRAISPPPWARKAPVAAAAPPAGAVQGPLGADVQAGSPSE